ncbi:MAG: addiction module protein [Pirellulaceae bacterium]|jgi:putative addiction module component (TIGR02574 family)|nr:addiction module protein [Pirellulaceae bacterium]
MSHVTIPPEILALPIPDRMALVDQIWDSIAEDESEFQLTNAQKAELDRRLARRQSSDPRGSDWGEVKRRIVGET